ncbi:TraB/GumN family protein [Massilia sp. PAMC28688]|uniref:TraB/GumN family protein n=1 Tax=Massilia sp. PAMC28688 TaxID=2861283 RepID=UPI001C63780E|nr:TraB/GumN family protein [Massilia sp. PAMC28688]QYF95151.1 TraB/GumN family protein [Massilia sp. PAMC28688]
MRRQIITVFLSVLCLLAGPAWGADRGALFKVAANGHTMYLFGTMHVGQPGFYPLEPRIADAVSKASVLALEIDPAQDPAIIAQAMQAHGMKQPGESGAPIAPALRRRIDKAISNAGLDPEAVARLKPWLVATVLAMAEYASLGYRADLSVDGHLAQLARAAKVPIVALETPASQMSLFSRLSEAEQLRLLEDSVALIESGKQSEEVRMIVEAWRTADQEGFDKIAERTAKDTSVAGRFMKKVLLDERNVAMADKLAGILARTDNAVAAVGVLHLVGNGSVPALLRARGLQVERVY